MYYLSGFDLKCVLFEAPKDGYYNFIGMIVRFGQSSSVEIFTSSIRFSRRHIFIGVALEFLTSKFAQIPVTLIDVKLYIFDR